MHTADDGTLIICTAKSSLIFCPGMSRKKLINMLKVKELHTEELATLFATDYEALLLRELYSTCKVIMFTIYYQNVNT